MPLGKNQVAGCSMRGKHHLFFHHTFSITNYLNDRMFSQQPRYRLRGGPGHAKGTAKIHYSVQVVAKGFISRAGKVDGEILRCGPHFASVAPFRLFLPSTAYTDAASA